MFWSIFSHIRSFLVQNIEINKKTICCFKQEKDISKFSSYDFIGGLALVETEIAWLDVNGLVTDEHFSLYCTRSCRASVKHRKKSGLHLQKEKMKNIRE